MMAMEGEYHDLKPSTKPVLEDNRSGTPPVDYDYRHLPNLKEILKV